MRKAKQHMEMSDFGGGWESKIEKGGVVMKSYQIKQLWELMCLLTVKHQTVLLLAQEDKL